MQTTADAAQQARIILDTDSGAIGVLRELLLEEREALVARDTERLSNAVQRKLECLMQLERNEQSRRQLIQHCGDPDWSRLLVRVAPALCEDWDRLRVRLRDVAELTEANEKIVNRSRHSTARLLSLVRGRVEEPDGVYDRSGRTGGYGDRRAITSA